MTALRAAAVFAVVLLLSAAGAWAQVSAPRFPPLTGRVVDAAGVLPVETESRLSARLEALETGTGRQLVVATVPSLQGYEIEEYGYRLGRAWGIGREREDDGAILLVAPNERRVRVEVGYGLEGVLTDALSAQIIHQSVLPRFRAGDLPGGVEAGADALIRHLSLPAEEASARAAAAARPRAAPAAFGDGLPGWLVFLIVIFVLFLLLRGGGGRGRRRRRGDVFVPPVVIWSGGSGWGGGGGSFGGGGGFSGGGGSFGGGGASGSW